MSSQFYVKDLDKLRAFTQYLSRFANQILALLSRIDQSLRAESDWIEDRKRFWAREVVRRQKAFDDCRNETRNSGGGQDCSSERQALSAAQETLAKAQKWAVRIEQAIAENQSQASQAKRLATSELPKAVSDLGQIVGRYQAYLTVSPPAIAQDGNAGGTRVKTHDASYQKARRIFMMESLFDENTPKWIKGHIWHEIQTRGLRPGAYWRSPVAYHVGHRTPGLNDPSNFRWEFADMNSLRGSKWHR